MASRYPMRDLCKAIDVQVSNLFSRCQVPAQPDSRAYGSVLQDLALREWAALCRALNAESAPEAGKKCIYDGGLISDGRFIGVDIRSKDLDANYSDGGLCSVKNLFRFLTSPAADERLPAMLVMTEIGYTSGARGATIEHVFSAPLHMLPVDRLSVENLGTGQVRFEGSLASAAAHVDWGRTPAQFFEMFLPVCCDAYRTTIARTEARIASLAAFSASGWTDFKMR